MGGGHRRQSARHRSHRLIPRHSFEPSTALRPGASQRRQQARLWVDHHPVIGSRALIAEPATTDGMVPVTPHVPDRPVAHRHLDAARVVAVAWTGREDGLLRRSHDTLYHATEAGSATRTAFSSGCLTRGAEAESRGAPRFARGGRAAVFESRGRRVPHRSRGRGSRELRLAADAARVGAPPVGPRACASSDHRRGSEGVSYAFIEVAREAAVRDRGGRARCGGGRCAGRQCHRTPQHARQRHTHSTAHAAARLPYENPMLPIRQRVQDLLSRMTLAEKIGQMTQAERGSVDTDTSKITTDHLGQPAVRRWVGADAEHAEGVGRHGRPLSAGGSGHAAAHPTHLRHRHGAR